MFLVPVRNSINVFIPLLKPVRLISLLRSLSSYQCFEAEEPGENQARAKGPGLKGGAAGRSERFSTALPLVGTDSGFWS